MPQQEATQKELAKKVEYKDVTKKSLTEKFKGTFPKKLISTKYFVKILIAIFVIVFVISASKFPFSSLMSGDMDVSIDIGYPLSFLEIKLLDNEGSPFLLSNFLLDLIMYIILAYILNILLNLVLKSRLFQSKEKLKENPTIFKNKDIKKEIPKSPPLSPTSQPHEPTEQN